MSNKIIKEALQSMSLGDNLSMTHDQRVYNLGLVEGIVLGLLSHPSVGGYQHAINEIAENLPPDFVANDLPPTLAGDILRTWRALCTQSQSA